MQTGFAEREFTHAYTEMEIRRYKHLGEKYKASAKQMQQSLDAQLNGVVSNDIKRINDNWQIKDCKNALLSSIAVYFPEVISTNLVMILMAEGFFDDDFEKLREPFYQLCQKPEHEGWCDLK